MMPDSTHKVGEILERSPWSYSLPFGIFSPMRAVTVNTVLAAPCACGEFHAATPVEIIQKIMMTMVAGKSNDVDSVSSPYISVRAMTVKALMMTAAGMRSG